MADPLVVNVVELLRRPGTERMVETTTTLSDVDVVDERLDPEAVVSVALHLESLTDGVVVDGTVRVPWRGICRRCLIPVEGVAVGEVHELYQRVLTDPDAFELEGDQIDLRPVVREVALLEAPLSPLCRADCAGLCPECGVDKNRTPCTCAAEVADPRWAALDDWRDGG